MVYQTSYAIQQSICPANLFVYFCTFFTKKNVISLKMLLPSQIGVIIIIIIVRAYRPPRENILLLRNE